MVNNELIYVEDISETMMFINLKNDCYHI